MAAKKNDEREPWFRRALVEGAIAGIVAPVIVVVIVTLSSGYLQTLVQAPSCDDPKDLTLIVPVGAEASGPTYEDTFNGVRVSYPPHNAMDTNSGTAWVEGASGYGLGEWLRFSFDGSPDIQMICVVNGYALNEDRYRANARVRQFDVTTAQGSKVAVLADLPLDDIATFQQLRLPQGRTDAVTLTIRSTSSMGGTQAVTDTAISEVEFWGR